jgi:positive regulator of sigma E activity
MDNPVGTIRAIHETHAGRRFTVVVDAAVACPRCAAGKGCGAGLFTGQPRQRVVEATAGQSDKLAVGDTVQLRPAAANLFSGALIVYGLPLCGALAGTALAYGLRLGDSAAAAAAIAGLAAGVALGRWRLRQTDCLQSFVPHVEKRL